MRARRPTSAMPKQFLCCERAFCRSMVVMFCALKWSVLMSWCLLRGQVMWWSRHLVRCDGLCCVMSRDAMRCHGDELYYKVLLQYYPVLQSTTPVLPCSTKYYSSTTLYYTVLLQYSVLQILLCILQYYSVLQSTTPILLRTTNTTLYYSSTAPALTCTTKNYSLLQSTTPVVPCTGKYYSSTNLYYQYYPVLQSTTLSYKVLLQYYSVLQSTTPILRTTDTTLYTPVLPCPTKYYSSTTLYYKVLLQYYSVLQILLCTTPVLPSTTKYYSSTTLYYSSTTLYYKVLLQYYPVLQSTTPVLTCTTKYYSNTALYYKVLLQYYSVPQSTTLYDKVLLQYYSVLQILLCTTPVLPCTTQYYSSTTLYYKVLIQYYPVLQSTSWLIRITYETSFTMRRATGITLQLHQILRLPRKMNLMIDPHHIWNVIYNAQSNRHHPPTSPNTAPATQNESHDWSTSYMKRHLQCAEQQSTPSNLTKYGACHAKWISWLIRITYETSFTMRGATGITLRPHQILRLPRKMNRLIDPHQIWNVIYNARSSRHHPATSPNTAPATQNESHDWSTSNMKRHLQCAEQQASPSYLTKYGACHAKWMSWLIRITYMKRHLQCGEQQASTSNLTKYCACHAKWAKIRQKFAENSWNVISNARPIRDRSEHDPTQKTQTATRRAAEGTFRTR